MSKIYFSRSISRTLSADHPVGDPTGGAAYGEKNDPISAVLSIAAMGSTYAAAGSFAAMTIMQGVTFAGAAVSLVGNVTGNKTLAKIGMAAGIIGGLGQMGAFGEGVKGAKWGDSFGSSTDTTALSASTAKPSTAPLKGSPAAGDLADDIAARNADYAGAQKVADSNVAAGARTTGTGAQPYINKPSTVGSGAQTSGASGVQTSPSGVQASPGYTGGSSYTSGAYNQSLAGAADKTGAYADFGGATTEPGFWSGAWQGTKDIASGLNPITNPYGAMAVGQIAQPIADYLSGKTDAEIEALEAQTGYADAGALKMQEEIAREKRRRENLNAGYTQVNTGINVNPNANMAQPGLIAQQMPQA